MRLVEYLIKLAREKKYGKILLIIIVIASLAAFVGTVLSTLLQLVREYYQELIFLITSISLMWYFVYDRRQKRMKANEIVSKDKLQQMTDEEKVIAENNYYYVHQAVYIVINELHETLNLDKPVAMSAIENPVRFYQRNNVTIYQFSCSKQGNVDVIKVKDYLQNRMEQKLKHMEFPGISQTTYIYEGRTFDIFKIDRVQDMNSFLLIDVVMVNEAYCKQQHTILQARNHQTCLHKDTFDKDF